MKKRVRIQIIVFLMFFCFGFVSCKFLINSDVNITDPKILIEKYLNSDSWQERLNFVYDSATTKVLMKEYYKNYNFKNKLKFKDITQIPNENVDIKKDSLITMSFTIFGKNIFGTGIEQKVFFFIIPTNKGLKIDWQSSVGYNPVKLNVYKASKPSNTTILKVVCKISDYYNHGYRNKIDDYYSIECSSNEPNSLDLLYGFISKKSEDGKRIYEILKDGNYHNLTLALQYNYKSEESSDVVEIKKIVSPNWFSRNSPEITNNEILLDYLICNTDDINLLDPEDHKFLRYKGFPDKDTQDKFFTKFFNYVNKDGSLTIEEKNYFNGVKMSESKSICKLSDNELEVIKIISNNIVTGNNERSVSNLIIKLPLPNKKSTWDYTDNRDGTKYFCTCDFDSIEFQGTKTKCLIITEKNSHFKDIITYKYYIKGLGLFKECIKDKTGHIQTTKILYTFEDECIEADSEMGV